MQATRAVDCAEWLTWQGNTGDSAVAMGRIAWADGRARYLVACSLVFPVGLSARHAIDWQSWMWKRRTSSLSTRCRCGDVRVWCARGWLATFRLRSQADLIANTWMYERYTCASLPTHNNYYIEYPEAVVDLIAEVRACVCRYVCVCRGWGGGGGGAGGVALQRVIHLVSSRSDTASTLTFRTSR